MNDYAEIRSQLEATLRQLVARAEEIDNDLSDPVNADWEERASETEGDEVKASVGNLALQEIEQIKHALRQMDEGSYGLCENCGGKIAKARLEALPYATKCIACA